MTKILAVTGGDAAGKTDCWKRLSSQLKQEILQVPEVATALMESVLPKLGVDIEISPDVVEKYQGVFRLTQVVAEDAWKTIAALQGKRLLWCDRGIPDLAAYDPGGWPAVESAFGQTKAQLYRRYDHVIVLRSLATVNPALYLEVMRENPCRTPRTVEAAQALDQRTYAAWQDHPGLIEVDCTRGMAALVAQVEACLGTLIDGPTGSLTYDGQPAPVIA